MHTQTTKLKQTGPTQYYSTEDFSQISCKTAVNTNAKKESSTLNRMFSILITELTFEDQ